MWSSPLSKCPIRTGLWRSACGVGPADWQTSRTRSKLPRACWRKWICCLAPCPKEDIIARLVSRELARLNLSNRKDLNEKAAARTTTATAPRRTSRKGGFKKGGYKKDFKGRLQERRLQEGLQERRLQEGPHKGGRLQTSGFNTGFNDGGFPMERPVLTVSVPQRGGFKKGGAGKGRLQERGIQEIGGFGELQQAREAQVLSVPWRGARAWVSIGSDDPMGLSNRWAHRNASMEQ